MHLTRFIINVALKLLGTKSALNRSGKERHALRSYRLFNKATHGLLLANTDSIALYNVHVKGLLALPYAFSNTINRAPKNKIGE